MKYQEWIFEDHSKWPVRGPWDNEPDKAQWEDPDTGLPCLIVRHNHGHWCGYVGVAPGHPAYGKKYGDVHVEVHGGLTFADYCQPVFDKENPEHRVCHVVEPGESDNRWWLGFDCGHGWDLGAPRERWELERYIEHQELAETNPAFRQEYRTLDYVTNECRDLARQLKEMA